LSQSTRLTDGKPDGILIARPRLHSMQRGKKRKLTSDITLRCNKAFQSNRIEFGTTWWW